MMQYKVAVVGALGAVGQEMIKTLEQRRFPVSELLPLDVPSNVGKTVRFGGKDWSVKASQKGAFVGVDLALFAVGAEVSLELAPIAVAEGCVVVDNSSGWRMDKGTPLVVPEVNPEALDGHKGIIANPNCSTVQMLVALKPLHDAFTIKRIVVSTYQAVSGTGAPAIQELKDQAASFVAGTAIANKVYPRQILFNALPHIDDFLETGYTKEEMKMVNETHKIMDPAVEVCPTAVRVPIFRGHSESINIETEKPIDPDRAREILRAAPGVKVMDDPGKLVYPTALDADGQDATFVGRIRRDPTVKHGLNLWVVSDNLRKGAALNAVQIAEVMIQRGLLR
jgi:aspartate-semialdehyde dehydrogenase